MGVKVLHVEVGGSYGGSLKALETYLSNCDSSRMQHEVLLYYPTPGLDVIKKLANVIGTLYSAPDICGSEHAEIGANQGKIKEVWSTMRRGIQTAVCVMKLRRVLNGRRYDLVHINNTFTYQVCTAIAAWCEGVPVIGHARNPVRHTVKSRQAARLLSGILAVNRFLAEDIKSWCRRVPVHCCYDGVPHPRSEYLRCMSWRKRLLDDTQGRVLIGSVGRLDPQKGFDIFVRAARIIADVYPGARFAIAGDGPARLVLEALVVELNLAERFQFTGFEMDVGSFISALDVFVCSSRWEGGPYTVVEALMLRRPVISTSVGFASELLTKNYLTVHNNPEALANRIVQILADPDTMSTVDVARARAISLTDPVKNAKALDDLLQEYAVE